MLYLTVHYWEIMVDVWPAIVKVCYQKSIDIFTFPTFCFGLLCCMKVSMLANLLSTVRTSKQNLWFYCPDNSVYTGDFCCDFKCDFAAISNRPCKLLAIPRRLESPVVYTRNRASNRSKNRQCKRALRSLLTGYVQRCFVCLYVCVRACTCVCACVCVCTHHSVVTWGVYFVPSGGSLGEAFYRWIDLNSRRENGEEV